MVNVVQAEVVDVEAAHGLGGDGGVDVAVGADLGVVANAAEEAVGDARGAASAAGDFAGAFLIYGDVEDGGVAADDLGYGLRVVEVEAVDGAEAVAQGRAEHGVAGGGADEGEVGNGEADAAGAGALAEDDVEGEVLHRGIEHLFGGAWEAVDLVDEEDVMFLEVGQDGGEVAGALDGGAGGDANGDAHLGGDDVGEGGLAEAGGP